MSRAAGIIGISITKADRFYFVLPDEDIIRNGGKPVQEMKHGDVINIPPEVKHWHGNGACGKWCAGQLAPIPYRRSKEERRNQKRNGGDFNPCRLLCRMAEGMGGVSDGKRDLSGLTRKKLC